MPCVCCPQGSPLALVAHERELPLVTLPAHNPTGWKALWRLWWWQQQNTPLVLHSFCADSLRLCTLLRRSRRKAPTVLVHSIFGHLPTLDAQTLALCQSVDRIICASALARNDLVQAGFTAHNITLVHPGLDMETLPHRGQRARTVGRFVFVALAPLETFSGLNVLIRAMAALWQRDDLGTWEVRIAGSGTHFTALLEEAQDLRVDRRLSLLGAQCPQDVLPWADVVLAPADNAYGNALALEWAWAMRLPLICSGVPAHTELACDRRNALIVAPGDPQELAAAMICLMRLDDLRTHLERAGKTMHAYISQERAVRQIRAAYTRCAPHMHPAPLPQVPQVLDTPGPLPQADAPNATPE